MSAASAAQLKQNTMDSFEIKAGMKEKLLLPQDIYLLESKWSSPFQWPIDNRIAPFDRGEKFRQNLGTAIAEWLSDGILAFQYSDSYSIAFEPIAHLVGTSIESVSYLEDLSRIADELNFVESEQSRRHSKEMSEELAPITLGSCFAVGVAKAAEILAFKLYEQESEREACFFALLDALSLIQSVVPDSAGSALCAVWSKVQESRLNDRLPKRFGVSPWKFKHAFVKASFPICDKGNYEALENILQGMDQTLATNKDVPEILKIDLKDCIDRMTIRRSKTNKIKPASKYALEIPIANLRSQEMSQTIMNTGVETLSKLK